MDVRALKESDLSDATAVEEGQRLSRRGLIWFSAIAAAISASVLVFGWGQGHSTMVRWVDAGPAMVPETAMGLGAVAVTLLLWAGTQMRAVPVAGGILVAAMVGMPTSTLEMNVAYRLGDSLSLTTRLELASCAVLLLMLGLGTRNRLLVRAYWTLATLTLLAAGLSLARAILEPALTDRAVYSALPTVLASACLSCALLLAPERPGWVHAILTPSPSRRFTWLWLPLALLGPMALSAVFLHLGGAAEGMPLTAGLAYMSGAGSAVAIFSLVRLGRSINRNLAEAQRGHDRQMATKAALAELEARRLAAMEEKYEALGRISAGIAHDFNNMLAVVHGNLELIDKLSACGEVRGFAGEALAATQRGAELVDRLRSYGRRSILSPKPFDAAAGLRAMQGRLSSLLPPQVSLLPPPPGGETIICVDRTAFGQAILSLVANARDAIKGPGRIRLDVRDTTVEAPGLGPETDELFHVPPGRYTVVTVRDTGPGIPPAIRRRVVEPFFTTKGMAHASGMGLSMVFGFCRQSQGYLRIDDMPGSGARVALFFPHVPCTQKSEMCDGCSVACTTASPRKAGS